MISNFSVIPFRWLLTVDSEMASFLFRSLAECRKSCVYVIKTFLMRIEFDCLVDRKGIGIEPVIVGNFNQSENTLYNLQYLCSRNRGVL